MKLLRKLVSPFYSVETRSSSGQLSDDFGDYPPKPLSGIGVVGKFHVVRIKGVGEIYSQLVAINRTLRGKDLAAERLSKRFIDEIGSDQLYVLRHNFEQLGRGERFVKPVAIALVLGLIGCKSLVKMMVGAKESSVLGAFVPIRENESDIYVKIARHRKKGKCEAPTISHEHIHLLQHRDAEAHVWSARSPESFLEPERHADPFLLYLLLKVEVEARLHEVVLSYYRASQCLPTTVPAFLGMLAASQQMGEYFSSIFRFLNIDVDWDVGPFSNREPMYAEDLESIIVFMKTPELAGKFLAEVLPVMYGNLLRYYGDDAASQRYLAAIRRPNFYDELYGVESPDETSVPAGS